MGGFGTHAGNRALLSQLEHFAFSVCLIRCSFKELPVFTRRERDTHFHKAEVFAVSRTDRRGRESGRRSDVKKRSEQSNYVFCSERCRCLSG